MTVIYDQFHELFMATNPDIVFSDENQQADYSLDKLLGSNLVVRCYGNKDVDLPKFMEILEKEEAFSLVKPGEIFLPALFIFPPLSDEEGSPYTIEITEMGLQYFNTTPLEPNP